MSVIPYLKDAEFVSETVIINRLYHRQLIARMNEIQDLEKQWKCKIEFPYTESASDVVTISGPEYQVPQAVDQFLGMVPESHEIVVPATPQLKDFLSSQDFETELRQKLKSQYEVNVQVHGPDARLEDLKLDTDDDKKTDKTTDKSVESKQSDKDQTTVEKRILLQYTRNNAGGLKDAIDFLVAQLIPHGLDAETVKGAIPRPKSDSFEDSLPFFDSKLLHNGAPTPIIGATDSPTRSTFGGPASSVISLNSLGNGNSVGAGAEDTIPEDRSSLFGKIRKPGSISSISSFILDRRSRNQNQSHHNQQAQSSNQSPSGTQPPSARSSSIFFKQAFHSSTYPYSFSYSSSNASRASLVSMESRDSGYRNPWNDSGISVNLPEGEELSPTAFTNNHSHSGSTNGWGTSKSPFFGNGKAANRSSGSLVSLNSMNPPGSATAPTFATSGAGSMNGGLKSPSLLGGHPGPSGMMPGDMTPRHMHTANSTGDFRASLATSSSLSLESMVNANPIGMNGRPGTSHSVNSVKSGLSFNMGAGLHGHPNTANQAPPHGPGPIGPPSRQ